jgi:hypothetical protein
VIIDRVPAEIDVALGHRRFTELAPHVGSALFAHPLS